jgi:hypothetical protein
MVKLSDHDVDEIVSTLDRLTKYITDEGFRGKYKDEEIRKMFEKSLRNFSSSGWKNGVCQKCLGTGYQTDSENKT